MGIVCSICAFVLLLAKMIAVVASCLALHVICQQTPAYADLTKFQLFAIFAVISFIAFIIASIFLSVYEMALDTIFVCFCEDQNRNDGSAEKPYACSARLQKFMVKNA